MESSAVFRIASSRARFQHPRPAQVGDLDAGYVVRRLDRDRDRRREHPSRYAGFS